MSLMDDADDRDTYGGTKRPLWQWVFLYVLIGLVAYGLIYYFVLARGNNTTNNQVGQTPTTTQQKAATPTTVPSTSAAAMQVTVSGNEFAFAPSIMTVKTGQPVQLTFKNTGQFPHNLIISDLNIQTKTIQPGEQDIITFTPNKAGSFTYICGVDAHADKGMTGTLTVQ